MPIDDKLINAAGLKAAYDALDDKIDGLTPSDIGAVDKNGDTMTGAIYFPSQSGVYSSTGSSVFNFQRGASENTDDKLGAIVLNTTASHGKRAPRSMMFRTYSYDDNTGDIINNKEQYSLPAVETNLSEDKSYSILTTKSGAITDSTDQKNARANLNAVARIVLVAGDVKSTDAATASAIYDKLSVLNGQETATVYLHGDVMVKLTNGKLSIGNHSFGFVERHGGSSSTENTYHFWVATLVGKEQYVFTVTITSSTISYGDVYKYTGTKM